MSYEVIRPSDTNLGEYAFEVMEAVCDGCPLETGWLYNWVEHDTPECALFIKSDERCLVVSDSITRPVCPERTKLELDDCIRYRDAMFRTDLEKFRKRKEVAE